MKKDIGLPKVNRVYLPNLILVPKKDNTCEIVDIS